MYKVFLISILIFPFASNAQSKENPTILFVCEHGAARSTIAAAYFNKIAQEKGLNYKAVFKGTDPQSSLTPGTKIGLTKDGFDVSRMKPLPVSKKDVAVADQVITFDCALPDSIGLTRKPIQWNGIPPISENYENARDQIVIKVNELLRQLAKK